MSRRGRIEVVHVLARDALAGTETMVAALAEHSAPSAVRTRVLILDRPGPVAARLRAAGVPVASLGGGRPLVTLARLAATVRRRRIDVLCGYGFRASLATRVLARVLSPGTRVVAGIRGLYVTEVERIDGPRGRVVMAIERATSPLVDAYVANSPGALRVLERHGIGTRRLHWIANGLDARRWTVPDRDGRDGPPLIVCVGRFSPVKRQADLVAAAALLAERGVAARFLLAGVGPTAPDVWDDVRRLGLEDEVRLLGALSTAEVAALLSDADIACLPSLQEGMPGAVMEAMASGLPVVGTDVNGIADLVRDGETGLIVPAGDHVALAAALERLVRDAALRRRLGEAGRRRIVEELSLDRMVAETTALYGALTGR